MDRRPPSESYVLLGLASAGYFLFTFTWFSLAAFLPPVIEELGLTSTQAGIVSGAIQLSYIPLSLVSGLVIDRLGSRSALGAGLFVIGAAHVVRGLPTGFVTILLPTLLIGVGGMAVTFGLPKLVSELFPPERSGTMSSVYMIGATLGSATVFAVARPLIGPFVGGWRPFFWYTGAVVVGFAAVWTVASWYLWGRIDEFPAQADDQTFSLASMREDLVSVVTHYGLFLVVIVATLRLFITHGLSSWLPTILEARGVTPTLAGTLTSLFILVRVLGIVSVPVLSDRFSTRRLPIVACGLAGTLGLLGLVVAGGVWTLTLSLVLIGTFVIGGLSPLVRALPIEMAGIGPRLTAVATGLMFTFGEVGGFAGPFLIGALRDLTGAFAPSLVVLAVASLGTAVAGYFMDEPAEAEYAESAAEPTD
ncbi:MFS transporter [Salinigranum rubrum]|uniref:MFS transporter n=1 Tax=Salinigranum rubrum TaxID=755307 RepID=UPI001FE531FA|nr:MFS transporter [Salinigranum rubrum]